MYITTPIYYVNAKPHIGHAYTTVAADVLARFFRLNNKKVFFLTGTDEHGKKIAEQASAAGLEPEVFCGQIADQFKLTWQLLNISHDDFIRTTEARHSQLVKLFLTKLKDKNLLYEKEYEGLYCVGCEKFVTPKELVDGLCPDHKKAPEAVREKNWFFKLEQFLPILQTKIEQKEIKIFPSARSKEVFGLFKQNLENFSISREKVKWGIPLPWDKSQTVYVWGDALLNYLTAVYHGDGQELKENDLIFWPPDYQFMAKDIIKFHAIYWPAMLLALDLPLPKKIVSHGYFIINGQKMSKTLGNIISPEDLVKQFGVDASRYLLLSQFPFGSDGDFDLAKVKTAYTADLVNGLGNLVRRVQGLSKIRKLAPADTASQAEYQAYSKLIIEAKFDQVIQFIKQTIARVDKLIENNKLWELKKDQNQTEKYASLCQQLADQLALIVTMIEPFMPTVAEKIRNQTIEILFPRI